MALGRRPARRRSRSHRSRHQGLDPRCCQHAPRTVQQLGLEFWRRSPRRVAHLVRRRSPGGLRHLGPRPSPNLRLPPLSPLPLRSLLAGTTLAIHTTFSPIPHAKVSFSVCPSVISVAYTTAVPPALPSALEDL